MNVTDFKLVIDPALAHRFIKVYKKFLLSIYTPDGADSESQSGPQQLHAARARYLENRNLLDEYVTTLEAGTEPIDRQMILAIRNLDFSRWVYLRDLKSCSIFIKEGGGSGYGVLGLTDEISVLTGGGSVVLEMGIVVLDDHYVCDGLFASLVRLGPGYRKSYNELYKELRQEGNFHVNPTLPSISKAKVVKPRAAARQKDISKAAKKEPAREKRIEMEIVVDAYGALEQAMGWYYYLENNMKFPFPATCSKKRDISPLKLNEQIQVVGLAPEIECEREMFVSIFWQERRFSVPLDQLECDSRDKKTRQTVDDWHYWVRQGYQFG